MVAWPAPARGGGGAAIEGEIHRDSPSTRPSLRASRPRCGRPRPVRSRWRSAARMALQAVTPLAISAIEMPALATWSLRAGDGEEPGLGLDQEVVGLPSVVRAALAIAGDRAGDEPRAGLAERRRAEAEPFDARRARGSGRRRRPCATSAFSVATDAGVLEVEREALLRPVGPDEVAREPARPLVVGAGEVAAVRPLDLDDARALVGEEPGAVGRGDRLFEGDDEDAVERTAHGGSVPETASPRRRPRARPRRWRPTASSGRRDRAGRR